MHDTRSHVDAGFVGRRAEMVRVAELLDAACAGFGHALLIAGEPGIGKTRLAEQIEREARERGLCVLWGRCWESDAGGGAQRGSAAYGPWSQVLRPLLQEAPADAITLDERKLLAQLLPELHPDPSPTPTASGLLDDRARLFDAAVSLIGAAARSQPTVIVLDDLHWADIASLLLEFVANELDSLPLLVVGTFRDSEAHAAQQLGQMVAAVMKEPASVRIALTGLTRDEVEHCVAAWLPDAGARDLLSARLTSATDGNPLFVTEMLRLLAADGRGGDGAAAAGLIVPESVREVIGRRIAPLSAVCQRALETAAVVGEEFDPEIVRTIAGLSRNEFLDALDEAERARLIVAGSRIGRFRFGHALVREVVYGELTHAARARLHLRAAEVLESVTSADGSRRAELAAHYLQAIPAGGTGRAVVSAKMAGDEALRQFAYEDAVRFYQMALDAATADPNAGPRERAELLLAIGEAQNRSTDWSAAMSTLLLAAAEARRGAMPEVIARAALAYGGIAYAFDIADDRRIELLHEALRVVDPSATALRANLMARLAMSLNWADHVEESELLSVEALRLARQSEDAAALGWALRARHFILWGKVRPAEALRVAEELAHIGEVLGDPELIVHGEYWRAMDLLELGDASGLSTPFRVAGASARELHQPFYEMQHLLAEGMRAQMEGRFEDARRILQQGMQAAPRLSGTKVAESFGFQAFNLLWACGGMAEREPVTRANTLRYPGMLGFAAGHALALAECDRREEAVNKLDEVTARDLDTLARDRIWLPAVAYLAAACVRSASVRHAAKLFDLLQPYSGYNVLIGPNCVYVGAVDFYLGSLATLLGRWDEAERLLEAALAVHLRLGARAWVVRTRAAQGALWCARAAPSDSGRAMAVLEEALAEATVLGMVPLATQAAADLAAARQRLAGSPASSLDDSEELAARLRSLEAELTDARSRALIDPLTGIANRAAWDTRMLALEAELARGKDAVALAVLDLDHFKRVNDTYGHSEGDRVLQSFAALCREHCGPNELVARLGGEEFGMLLASSALEDAATRLESLLDAVREQSAQAAQFGHVPFGVSIGLAHARGRPSARHLFEAADRALYAAKSGGRDRLCLAET